MTHHISPSQIKLWRDCKRKYGFKYIDKLREPTSPKMQFGTDVHAQLEQWLKKGKTPDSTPEGQVAKQGIRKDWLPSPGSHLLVEHKLEIPLPELGDVTLIGYIDCVEPPDLARRMPTVIDHKTTSSLNWALTEDELAADPQGLIYSVWAMQHFNTGAALARWLYYVASNPKAGPRKPAGAQPVDHVFVADDPAFARRWAELLKDVADIVAVRNERPDTATIEPSPPACGKFGGCYFNGNPCELSSGEILRGHLVQFERAHNKQLTHCNNSITVPAEARKEPSMPTLMEKLTNKAKQENKGKKLEEQAKDVAAAVEAKAKAKTDDGPKTLLDTIKEKAAGVGVNPPEGDSDKGAYPPMPDTTAEITAESLDELGKSDLLALAKQRGVKANGRMKIETIKTSILEALTVVTTQHGPPEKIVETTSASDPAVTELMLLEAQAADIGADATPSPTGESSNGKAAGLVVMFGCVFEKNQTLANGVYHLVDLLTEPMEAVCLQNDVPHWSAVEFGKGPGMLSAVLDEWWDEKGPKEGVIIADPSTAECRAVKETLRRRADVVIRSVQ
ncbi:hypothetical protein LCGC14_1433630 [marine sediment metagenome]|uniref:PD-(D/E)XK endonuclease-like domain-containing protein n=1 Tax=marine sediment metagenome TaxID=412755 RepID=A0A0F9JMT2_9ZZZZ